MKVLLPQATFLNGKLLVMTAAGNPNGVYDPAVDPNIHPPTQCTDLQIKEYYRDLGNGTGFSELVLSFINTDYYFNGSEIYIQSHSPTGAEIIETPSVLDVYSTDVKSAGAWHYYDTAVNALSLTYTSQGDVYTFKVVATNTAGLKADFNEAPTLTYTVRGKSIIPNIPTGMEVQFAKEVTWSWNHGDTDIDFWELRLEQNPGEQYGLLDKIGAPLSHKKPPNRSGAIYLYAHNAIGNYSTPLGYLYDKPKPPKPFFIGVDYIFQGFVVTTEDLPSDVIGINVYATLDGEDKVYYAPSNTLVIKTTSQYVGVRVAFVDIFGEGELSELKTYENVVKINAELLAAEAVSLEHMDGVIKEAVKKAQDSANAEEVAKQITDVNNYIINEVNTSYAQVQSDMADLTRIINTDIASAVATLEENKVSKVEFTDAYNLLVQADGANSSAILQTNTDVSTIVGRLSSSPDAEGQYTAISLVKQEADRISSTVSENKLTADGMFTTLTSNLTQTSGSLISVIGELKKDPYSADPPAYTAFSSIKQTTDTISATVATKASLAELKLTDDSITAMIGQLNKDPYSTDAPYYQSFSYIKAKADEITATVTANKLVSDTNYVTAMAQISLRADEINAVVGQLNKDPYSDAPPTYIAFSRIKAKTDEINLAVADRATTASLNIERDKINSVVTELNKPLAECSYTAISQTLDNIQFRASNGTVQSLLNISPQTVSIKSDFLHITSTVQIDNNVIVGRMIQSGAISSDHIASGGLPFSSLAAAAQDYINLASANASSAVTSTNLWKHGTDATYINGGMIFTGSITANQISAGTLTVGTFAPTIQAIINTAGGWRSNLDATYIDGGKLYTGSVTADKIQTGTITVGKLDTATQNIISTANSWRSTTNTTYINGGYIYTGTIQADAIATGVITIGKLDASTQSTITSASSNASSALTNAATAQTAANSANNKIATWCHINNTTLIDGGKIYTGSITADKISVNSLSAISATIGTFSSGIVGQARTVITDSKIEVYDANNQLRVRLGVW